MCDKRSYSSEREAREIINNARYFATHNDGRKGKRRTAKTLPVRTYFCQECEMWVLTSKKLKKKK